MNRFRSKYPKRQAAKIYPQTETVISPSGKERTVSIVEAQSLVNLGWVWTNRAILIEGVIGYGDA